ncbi:hypothetical protein NC651_030440 [Populus alba x Populus x berolinensis]|uniref:Uncharacterized protein n=1 Tax=Populus trichocarpa TaxID=3694 RepID=A0A3N7FW54_POPTR|nr:hypothetical protein NC651_030440 [Populus alba x Populus x berolinensis]
MKAIEGRSSLQSKHRKRGDVKLSPASFTQSQ